MPELAPASNALMHEIATKYLVDKHCRPGKPVDWAAVLGDVREIEAGIAAALEAEHVAEREAFAAQTAQAAADEQPVTALGKDQAPAEGAPADAPPGAPLPSDAPPKADAPKQ